MKEIKENFSLLIDSFIIGIIGAVCAEIFIFLLEFIKEFTVQNITGYISFESTKEYKPFFIIIIITIGGLISGFLVYTFAPEAEGHGTDAVIRAFHRTGGYIRPIVIPVKILASAITIGTGGSAGKEGPTALFSAGVGSFYADIRNASIKNRQMYVLTGMAAGLSAVFKAPVGSAFFSLEVLFIQSEFSTRELMFILFGALVSFTVTGYLFGWESIFHIPRNLSVTEIDTYLLIILFGFLCGLIASVIPNIFYYTRDFFRRIPTRPHLKPAIGAFFVGILAVWHPEILDGGYEWIQKAIDGEMFWELMLVLFLLKILAFSLTIGSGGSGGVFAPMLFVGAMFGGVYAHFFHQNVTIFSLLGMASIFGAAARTPLASVIIVMEMAKGYSLLVPILIAVFFSYFIHLLIANIFKLKYITLYEAQLININYSPIFQLEKLKDILLCYIDLIKLPPEKIRNLKLLELLESGEPIKLPDGNYLFFGQFKKHVKLKEINKNKYYKNLRVLYAFRSGKWLHPREIDKILENDEVLLYGKKEDIEKIRKEFIPLSRIFSKLKEQHEAIER